MKKEEKVKIIAESLELVKDAVKNGMSNYEIAKHTQINESTIGNYVNDKTTPTFANAKILISFFESIREPDFVYHYTTIEGLLGIFSSESLKLSDFSRSDDLRERMLYESSGIDVKYFCCCCGKDAGNKPAMWAKYARNDSGVCIKFDLEKLKELNAGGDFEGFKIRYITSDEIKTGQDVDWIRCKNENWSYQSEYRFISKTMGCLKIDRECVKWVSFGWESNTLHKDVVNLFQSAGLTNFSLMLKGEHVNAELTGVASISWNELCSRAAVLYKELMDKKNNNVKFVSTYIPDCFSKVKFVSIPAAASFVESLYGGESEIDTCDVIQENGEILDDNYLAFEVRGDSMDDGTRASFEEGDVVLVRELDRIHWRDGIRFKERPYWVVVFDSSVLIKQIVAQNIETGELTFHSLNNSPEYSDFKLNMDQIRALYYVLQKKPKTVNF